MDKPNCQGFAVIELNKMMFFETYYDEFQPYSGKNK